MPNFIEIGGVTRKFSKKLDDLTRNDPIVGLYIVNKIREEREGWNHGEREDGRRQKGDGKKGR